MMLKKQILGVGLGLCMMSSGTWANLSQTYQAMKLLADESVALNKEAKTESGIPVAVRDTVGVDIAGIEMIVQRANQNSVQYQRINGKALPFLVVIKNMSPTAVTFKPGDVRLITSYKEHQPMSNRAMQSLLKATNRKDYTLAEGIERLKIAAGASSSLVMGGGVMGLAKTVSMDTLNGTFAQSDMGKLYAMIESDIANEFRLGDEVLLHHDQVVLRSYSMTSFNVFFKEATLADADLQLHVPMNNGELYRFKFVSPATKF